jgi:hypothetical protein
MSERALFGIQGQSECCRVQLVQKMLDGMPITT